MAAPTLWHHPNFLRLWIGQSVSQFGNQFTGLALQFLALKTLLASPAQMGLLGAMGTLPFLLIGLLVGVWVDRHRRRPILIAGDLGRGFIVVTIAVFTLLGIVRMEYLYVLGFATGGSGRSRAARGPRISSQAPYSPSSRYMRSVSLASMR